MDYANVKPNGTLGFNIPQRLAGELAEVQGELEIIERTRSNGMDGINGLDFFTLIGLRTRISGTKDYSRVYTPAEKSHEAALLAYLNRVMKDAHCGLATRKPNKNWALNQYMLKLMKQALITIYMESVGDEAKQNIENKYRDGEGDVNE